MAKFYAVRKGRAQGIFFSWADCERQVKGFAGAEYKSFKTLSEAESYMHSGQGSECNCNSDIDRAIANIDESSAIAFVDGSFSADSGIYSYGALVFSKDDIKELSESYIDSTNASSRNVAGEIMGARAAISYAISTRKKKITLYYDYKGIELWANKEWKANLSLTKDYVRFIDEARKQIEISFVHVNAHSGIEYNERVDRLAKDALQKPPIDSI